MARPKKEIDWDEVDMMMLAGCKVTHIIGDLNIDDGTFYRRFEQEYGIRFQEYAPKMHSKGKGNILKVQYKKAVIDENVQMLTLLGEEWLGQGKEKQVEEIKYAGTTPIADIAKFCREQTQPETDSSDRGSQRLDEHLAGSGLIGQNLQQPNLPG